MLSPKAVLIWHFIKARWGLNFKSEAALQKWQHKQLKHYLTQHLPKAKAFRDLKPVALDDIPVMDKSVLLSEFAKRNCYGIDLQTASDIALKAEHSRDFSSTLEGLTVGMSSGTSGTRGVFLVSDYERNQWAGILLAKTLPSSLLRHILAFWRKPLSIAFFLRANSNLYDTLNSRRIDFHFYDLIRPYDFISRLNYQLPDVLVAPATVLAQLATDQQRGALSIKPKHIISVAEVLDEPAKQKIEAAFQQPVHQIYQATEGFLGYTCEKGGLHLNESHIVFEKNWIDEHRFEPVITDFTRTTQLITRYRLNDILVVADKPCGCGRAELHLARIEGRADEVLWLETEDKPWQAIYPDVMRRAFALVSEQIQEYSVFQYDDIWQVAYKPRFNASDAKAHIRDAIASICELYNARMPLVEYVAWQPPKPGDKLKRFRCVEKPAAAGDITQQAKPESEACES